MQVASSMEALLIIWLGCAVLGGIIAHRHQAAGTGAIVGLLFGPLGVIAAFALDGRPKCLGCQLRIDGTPEKCPRCGESLAQKKTVVRFTCQRCSRQVTAHGVASGEDFMTCPYCHELTAIRPGSDPAAGPASITQARLQPCPDCGHQVSRRAASCPQCGCPIAG